METEKNNGNHSLEEVPRSVLLSKKKAEKILRNQEKLERLVKQAGQKAHDHRERLQKIWAEIQLFLKMIHAYRSGEYRRIPWKALVMIVGAILYFVNPLDLIPDFIIGFGFLDDATVIGLVVKSLTDEIEKFKEYLEKQQLEEVK